MSFTAVDRPSELACIDRVWQGSSDTAARLLSVASTHVELVVARVQGRPLAAVVRGPETEVSVAEVPADGEWWGIRFALGTFLPRLPATALVDSRVELLDPGSRTLAWPGGGLPVPGLDDAEAFVGRLVRDGLIDFDPEAAAAVRRGAGPDWSRRTLQRRAARATGLSPATIRQIRRADRAVELLRWGRPILDTVHEAGYCDQSHLSRALRRWYGLTPLQVAGAAAGALSR